MKLLFFIFAAIVSVECFAQTDTQTDQIHLRDLSIIKGKVIEIDDELIKYKKKESADIFEIEIDEVSHVLFASGKLQSFKLQDVSKISIRKKNRELKNSTKTQEEVLIKEIPKPIEATPSISKVELEANENKVTEKNDIVKTEEVPIFKEVEMVKTQTNIPKKYSDVKPNKTLPVILSLASIGSLGYAFKLNSDWQSKLKTLNSSLSKGLTQEYATAYSDAQKFQSREKTRNVLYGVGGVLAILDIVMISKNKSKKNQLSLNSKGVLYSYKF